MTVEIFALKDRSEEPETSNLIAYASKIPVYNDQAQFTKHWKNNENFFEEMMGTPKDILYFVIKELDKDKQVMMTHYLHKELVEKKDEEN